MDAHDGLDKCFFDYHCHTKPAALVIAKHAATLNEDGEETCRPQEMALCIEHTAQMVTEMLRVLITGDGHCRRCHGNFQGMSDLTEIHEVAS